MRNPPVHWHEGLFLRPQHFQAADRYWTELIQTSEAWDHAYNYGLHALEFSREALANYQFQVHALRARMRDGTIISLDPGQEPDRVNLKDSVLGLKDAMADLAQAFESESIVRVYVAVPKLKIGRPNVSADGRTSEARYVESALTLQDESLGGGDQEIQLRNLNVRLLLSTQDLSGYEVLPIAQIKRAGEGEAVPQLDESYIPPVLGTDAWPGLGRDFVRAVYDLIGQKIDVLSQQVVNRGIGLDSRHPGDLDRILMLSELNAAYSGLAVLAFARGVHPLTAYLELCRIVGQLSIFSDQRRPTDIPAYDHDELARIFRWIRDRIDMLIHSVRDYEFEQRYFIGVGMGMQVSLEPRWFNNDWQWFIGIKKGELSTQECRDLLSPGQLDWKLGSARQV
ncbi:MAG: type VI secretion system baseplate subunit TssK, partial [Planctomycetaceae bacterium]